MRNERKYKVISLITALLSLLLLGNCAREYFRIEVTEYRHAEEYVIKGAAAYAQNCVQCHGPQGEGIIGMPLNRPDLRADADSPAGKDIYAMLYKTIAMGRQGNKNHFQWEKAPDGNWISYSTMPPWGKEHGGPYDTDYVKALTLFIMKADGSQWAYVEDPEFAPIPEPELTPDEKTGEITLPDSEHSDVNAAAQALLRNTNKTACLTCHTINGKGGKKGPDLSFVGSWGVDQAFIEEWIKNPEMAHEKRMPVYWSANRAGLTPDLNLQNKTVSEGPHTMPKIPLSDQEVATIARYLVGLKYKP